MTSYKGTTVAMETSLTILVLRA